VTCKLPHGTDGGRKASINRTFDTRYYGGRLSFTGIDVMLDMRFATEQLERVEPGEVQAMLRYLSRRHQFLMDESGQALSDAAEGKRQRDARIARQVLGDSKIHRLWESRHADLVLPVAEHGRRAPQIFALRDIGVRLLHRRALIRHIRNHKIVGKERDELFSNFYGPMDMTNAILAEHRQYTLAVSSRVSTDHLINVMHDPVSTTLLTEYESIYSKYFELYCFFTKCEDAITEDAIKSELLRLRRRAMQMIKRIHSERPQSGNFSIERQALLARSGRYPILDYMLV